MPGSASSAEVTDPTHQLRLFHTKIRRTGASESGENLDAGQPRGVSGKPGASSSSFFFNLERSFGILIDNDALRFLAASLSSACFVPSAKDEAVSCKGLGRFSLPAIPRNRPLKDSVDLEERNVGVLIAAGVDMLEMASSCTGARNGKGDKAPAFGGGAACSAAGTLGGCLVGCGGTTAPTAGRFARSATCGSTSG